MSEAVEMSILTCKQETIWAIGLIFDMKCNVVYEQRNTKSNVNKTRDNTIIFQRFRVPLSNSGSVCCAETVSCEE